MTSRSRASAFVFGGAVTSVVSLGLQVLRSKVSAHWVGPEGLGVVAEATQVVSLGLVVGTAAAHTPLLRALAQAERGSAAEDDAFSAAVWSTLALHAVGALAVAGVAWSWNSAAWGVSAPLAVSLTFIATLGTTLVTIAGQFLTVSGAVRRLTLSNVLAALWATLFGVSLTIALGVTGMLFGLALASAMNVVSSWALMRAQRGRWPALWPPRISVEFRRDMVTLGGTALLGSVAQQLLMTVTRRALAGDGGVEGLAANGQYQAALAIVTSYLMMVLSGLVSYYPPRFAACRSDGELQSAVDEAARAVLRYVVPIALLGIAVSGLVIRAFYSSRFDPAVRVLEVMLAASPLRLLSWAYASSLPMRGKGAAFLVSELAALALGAPLTIFAVGKLGLAGAALSYLALYALYLPVAAWLLWAALRVRPRPRDVALAYVVAGLGPAVLELGGTSSLSRTALALLGALLLWRSGLVAEAMGRVRDVLARLRPSSGTSS